MRFYYQMFASSNDIVTYIIKLACVSGNSPIGNNMSYLRYKYNVNFNDNVDANISRVRNSQLLNATQQGLVNAVFDLLYVREREMIIADFTDTMQEDIPYDITTN